jgi:hypothetical protein
MIYSIMHINQGRITLQVYVPWPQLSAYQIILLLFYLYEARILDTLGFARIPIIPLYTVLIKKIFWGGSPKLLDEWHRKVYHHFSVVISQVHQLLRCYPNSLNQTQY